MNGVLKGEEGSPMGWLARDTCGCERSSNDSLVRRLPADSTYYYVVPTYLCRVLCGNALSERQRQTGQQAHVLAQLRKAFWARS